MSIIREQELMIRFIFVTLVVSAFAWGAAFATDVSIHPSIVSVDPGTLFWVDVWKDSADIEFDGYQAVVRFDPEMIELVSAAEGTVMTNACWNRWWAPSPGEDSIFLSHVLVCGGLVVTGPGQLSRLQFRGLDEGITTITTDYFWFTLAGIWNKDVAWHNGVVVIGDQSGIEDPTGEASPRAELQVVPNPGRCFEIAGSASGEAGATGNNTYLDIYDARGRLVRTLPGGVLASGLLGAWWDGDLPRPNAGERPRGLCEVGQGELTAGLALLISPSNTPSGFHASPPIGRKSREYA
jgi:hypothetical protein